MSTPTAPPAATTTCLNCGDPGAVQYCPGCGQSTAEKRVSLRRLIADAIEDHLSLNATLPRTLHLLLLRPGRLTTEYLAGRRARYVPPLRLYLIGSFIYFLVVGLGVGGFVVRDTDEERSNVMLELTNDEVGNMDVPFLSQQRQDAFRARMERLSELEPGALDQRLNRDLSARLPIAVFLLVPVFAALLKLAYIRHDRFYAEHFVFALHLHAFVFGLFTIQRIIPWSPLTRALTLWLFVYLVLALRRVYGQSLGRTLLKFGFLAPAYGLLLGATIVGLLVFSLLLAPL